MKKISVRKDIDLFLTHPDFYSYRDLSVAEKIKILIKVLILTYLALFLVSIPISILEKMDIISQVRHQTTFILKEIQTKNLNYKPYYIFSTIFFVPLIEELSCRLSLTRFRVNYFIISVSIILGIFTTYYLHSIPNIFWIPKSYLLLSIMFHIYILMISASIGGVLYLFRTKINRIEEFWNKNSGLIIYAVAILFALAHIGALKYEHRDLIFMPLILMPFFVGGLSLGYLRVRLGIIYSMALHFVFLALNFGLAELAILLKSYTHL